MDNTGDLTNHPVWDIARNIGEYTIDDFDYPSDTRSSKLPHRTYRNFGLTQILKMADIATNTRDRLVATYTIYGTTRRSDQNIASLDFGQSQLHVEQPWTYSASIRLLRRVTEPRFALSCLQSVQTPQLFQKHEVRINRHPRKVLYSSSTNAPGFDNEYRLARWHELDAWKETLCELGYTP